MSSLTGKSGSKGGKITTWSWDDTIFCNISFLTGLIPNPTITIPSSFTCCEEFNARSGSSVKRTVAVKGAQSRYFETFWPHTKLPLNGRKPENNGLTR